MSQLSWQSITVQQFLDIYRLSLKADLEEMGKLERIICILFDKTEDQVQNMPMDEFTKLSRQVAFVMKGEIPGKAVKYIRVNKRKYRIIYDPAKLKHRQYVELLTFGEKPIENMHLVLASIVQRVNWFGKAYPNKVEDHEAIASDMLQAPVIAVYHSCVFFCNVYVNLIINIKDSLVRQMMNQGKSQEEADYLITLSISAMAGFIPRKNLRYLKV